MFVLLHRIVPEENMSRYYVVAVQPTLLDAVSVVTMWGSLETGSQMRQVISAETHALAIEKAEKIVQTKIRRGYCIVTEMEY